MRAAKPRVEGIAKTVAQEIDRQYGQREERPGNRIIQVAI